MLPLGSCWGNDLLARDVWTAYLLNPRFARLRQAERVQHSLDGFIHAANSPPAEKKGNTGPQKPFIFLREPTMERTAEARPRFRGRVAALFYLLNIASGSLALVFIGRKLALYADAANLTATVSYVIVTVLFYSIFKPANGRVSLLAAVFSLVGCSVGAINSFRLATVPVNALVFFGVYCLLIGYLISKSTFLPRVLGILMVIGGLGWLTFLSSSLTDALAPYNMVPGILAETVLTLWLLIPGINARRWKEQAAAVTRKV